MLILFYYFDRVIWQVNPCWYSNKLYLYLFSPLSVTFIQFVRGGYTCFFWRTYCFMPFCLCCRQFTLKVAVASSLSSIWWLIDRRAFNYWIEPPLSTHDFGMHPHEQGRRSVVGHFWSFQQSSKKDARRTNEDFWTRCCRHIHLLLQLYNFLFVLFYLVSRSEWFCSFPRLVGQGRLELTFYAFLKSFCERLPQAIIVFLFYSFHDNDKIEEKPQLRSQIEQITNTSKVYFIYKCVYSMYV